VRWRELSPSVAATLSRRKLAVAVVCVVLLGAGLGVGLLTSGGQQQAPPTSSPPPADSTEPPPPPPLSAGISLDGWKLSIPEENDDGDASTIEPAALKSPWLTAAPDGGLTFWAPASGATTKNSDNPRTELDSLTNFKAGTGPRTLTASVTLLQVPQDGGGIILGQIHGADDISSVPFVMLRFEDGQVRVVVKKKQSGSSSNKYPLLNNVGLNSRFDFTITDLGNGTMAFSATRGSDTHQVVAPIPAPFEGQTVRFQAGDYQQSGDPGGAQDGGRVIFHRLTEQSTAPPPQG
jgi:Alginate lyase